MTAKRLFASLLLLLFGLTGCGSSNQEYLLPEDLLTVWTPPDPAQSSLELQALVDETMAAHKIPAVLVGVWTPEGSWVRATGTADLATQRAATVADFSAWRSITKSMTVTVVLQLVAQGRVELDAPVGRYVQGVPGGDRITIRQLTNMTSGLYNYSSDPTFINELVADLTRTFTLDELLAAGFSHPLNFQPGSAYEYSNTNTLLLQRVAEAVTGESLEQLFAARIFPKLSPGSVSYLSGTRLPDPHLKGYTFDPEAQVFEELVSNGTALAGAGALVGTMEGLRDWGRLLVGGSLLPPALQAQRFESRLPTDGPLYDGYGLGMGQIGGWWGHTGNGLGYQASVFTEPVSQSCIVIMVNATNAESDLPAKLTREIQRQLGWVL